MTTRRATYLEEIHERVRRYGYLRRPLFIASGPISEAFPAKTTKLPPWLPVTARMNEFCEGEYMMANEYDLYMKDPSDYNLRVMLPRTSDFFAPFKKLPPMRGMMGASVFLSMLADPEIAAIVKKLQSMVGEQQKYMNAQMEITSYIRAHGYPPLGGFGMMAQSAFDHFADALRGTKGIVMDIYRQPRNCMRRWSGISIFPSKQALKTIL